MEPEILIPYNVSRLFIQSHINYVFVYGQDYSNKGCFGQAWQCANEPNSYPVPTLLKICNSSTDRFFYDEAFEFFQKFIDERINAIPKDGRPIIPVRNIGRGYSELYLKAPKLYKYIHDRLDVIKYPNMRYDYKGEFYPLYDTR